MRLYIYKHNTRDTHRNRFFSTENKQAEMIDKIQRLHQTIEDRKM